MDKTYIQLGDGFEFILPLSLDAMNVTLKFMANALYDFATNEWKKYGITVYDANCVQYQWRNAGMESRRQSFDDVPVIDYEGLCALGYMVQRRGTSAYVMNKSEYDKRRTAFVEKVKALPTTINLGVDEELKQMMDQYNESERERERQLDETGSMNYIPPRLAGITYVQLGDGFEFIIDRPCESLNHLLKLSSTQLYDMLEKKWTKYRSTMYKVDDQWHSKFIPNAEDRKLDLTHVQRLTYADLVTLGYMFDRGEGNMARYQFDWIAYRRRRRATKIVFDDAVAEENEVGTVSNNS